MIRRESLMIDIVAYLHRTSVEQIQKDLYGDRKEFKKRFGTKSVLKFENEVKRCMKEIEDGIHPTLASVAHNVPFILIHKLENNKYEKQLITDFFHDINKLNENEKIKDNNDINFVIMSRVSASL
ncbi:unnamed protein product [Rotaria socialis]|uniref:Uncharacterized protein n=1 Tax=Rotaria socialis TaxID=392032 RepID=A0A821G3W6_9BILA|nr:unnamed protein product [Rotaria socialis]CAF3708825.1 unnamed protein product [Rotaria socialis]CAF4244443.1 unnamed protein product [Rotaria socialis]CAF4354374.1 unnamed protein product [Rotaria socialis]CAF4524673.1 unnamed protein product [Rotaria socialis]